MAVLTSFIVGHDKEAEESEVEDDGGGILAWLASLEGMKSSS